MEHDPRTHFSERVGRRKNITIERENMPVILRKIAEGANKKDVEALKNRDEIPPVVFT